MAKTLIITVLMIASFIFGYSTGANDANIKSAKHITSGRVNALAYAAALHLLYEHNPDIRLFENGLIAALEYSLWVEIDSFVAINESEYMGVYGGSSPLANILEWAHEGTVLEFMPVRDLVTPYFEQYPPESEERQELMDKYKKYLER